MARAIPPGATVSYGDLATRLGAPGSARAVGQALGRNPFAIIVPCHRVLAAGGRVGGFTANGGVTTKLRLLSIEGANDGAVAGLADGGGAFGFDPAVALAHVRSADAIVARLIDTVGPFRMRLKKTSSLFVALAEAIVYQQLNGRAAATIYARVCALFPLAAAGPTPKQILRASDEKLRGAGLSRAKLLSLRDLAKKTVDGELPTLDGGPREPMTDEAIIERLTIVRGIGRWTVEMLLMFRLGRPDVLPVDDYGIRKGYANAFAKRDMLRPQSTGEDGSSLEALSHARQLVLVARGGARRRSDGVRGKDSAGFVCGVPVHRRPPRHALRRAAPRVFGLIRAKAAHSGTGSEVARSIW